MIRQESWRMGIDNRSPSVRIKDESVRDAVNMSPTDAGTFSLRPGYERVYLGDSVRMAMSIGHGHALVADGSMLLDIDLLARTAVEVSGIPPVGGVCGALLNGVAYVATASSMLRYSPSGIEQWVVPAAPDSFEVRVVEGNLPSGLYRLGCTFVDSAGNESGLMAPQRIGVSDGCSLHVVVPAPPPGLSVRFYSSVANGETMYLQSTLPGDYMLGSVRDEQSRCSTLGLDAMPLPTDLVVLGGRLVGVRGRSLYLSRPYQPHLHDPLRDFFQFEAVPSVVVPCSAGLFVCVANSTYYLSGIGYDDLSLRKVLEYGAVSGTGRVLPDGRCAWMSSRGVVLGGLDGSAVLLAPDRFVPGRGKDGASGAVNSNGSSLLVTTMRGSKEASPLAARDYFEAEYISP